MTLLPHLRRSDRARARHRRDAQRRIAEQMRTMPQPATLVQPGRPDLRPRSEVDDPAAASLDERAS